MMLKEYFGRKKRIRYWRKKNSHNWTESGNMYVTPESVIVGQGTYGTINVFNDLAERKLKIGHFCSIGLNTIFMLGLDHRVDTISTYPFKVQMLQSQAKEAVSKGDIIVEDDVWIGYGVTILSGVHIGQGSVIAAGAVVTKNVPAYAIVGGVPAKIIKYRFTPDIIEKLESVDYSQLTKELVFMHIEELYTKIETKEQVEKLISWMPKKNKIK